MKENQKLLEQTIFLRPAEVAFILGISRSTVYKLVKEGKLPKPKKLGARITVFNTEEIKHIAAL